MPKNTEISDEESQAVYAQFLAELESDPDTQADALDGDPTEPLLEQMSFDFPVNIPKGAAIVPQELSRTSLFTLPSDRRGKRKYLRDVTLQSNSREIQIVFTGEQMGPREETLWLTIIRLHRIKNIKFGQPLLTTIKELLAEMRLDNNGGEKGNRVSTLRRLIRMDSASMRARFYRRMPGSDKVGVVNASISLIKVNFLEGFVKDASKDIEDVKFDVSSTAPIEICLDPRGARLFEELAWQPYDIRLALKHDGSLRLLSYVCSLSIHNPEKNRNGFHQVDLNWLKVLFGYTSPLDRFKQVMETWLQELVEQGVIMPGWEITGHGKTSRASWTRTEKAIPEHPAKLSTEAH